ncbi:ABC transporter permease subunit [Clostridium sp. Marseille-P299]|uniref:ABC transporter permease subunit n=1 Tax=Clostridium sp. Marseille-P299 TaxID=1805477 RepID=UPI0008369470|nr:ABC transporter permease subunit [Clostridium sp. Marseille-P299]
MCNKTLFKSNVKSNYILLLIIAGVLLMYTSIMLLMYNPESNDKINQLMAMFPEEIIGAFGFKLASGSLIEFLTSYLYGFIYLIFPLIIEMVVAHRIIARHVDKGSMAYILSTPNKRTSIAFTQLLFLEACVFVIIVYITIITIICSTIAFPGLLDIGKLLYVNLGLFLLHSALSGICFLGSCIANDSKTSLSIGVGVTVTFYVIQMLANMGDKLEFLKYVTIFTLFQPSDVLEGKSSVILSYAILASISIACYLIGTYQFSKRDLPL